MWTGTWVETLKALKVISYVFKLYVGFEKNKSEFQSISIHGHVDCMQWNCETLTSFFWRYTHRADMYWESCQLIKTELFAQIGSSLKLLTVFGKSFILDDWQCPE